MRRKRAKEKSLLFVSRARFAFVTLALTCVFAAIGVRLYYLHVVKNDWSVAITDKVRVVKRGFASVSGKSIVRVAAPHPFPLPSQAVKPRGEAERQAGFTQVTVGIALHGVGNMHLAGGIDADAGVKLHTLVSTCNCDFDSAFVLNIRA